MHHLPRLVRVTATVIVMVSVRVGSKVIVRAMVRVRTKR